MSSNRRGKGNLWTPEEDECLRANYDYTQASKEFLLEHLGRSWQAIKSRANRLGLTKSSSESWTDEEEALLTRYWLTQEREKLKDLLPNRTWESLKKRAYELDVTQSSRDKVCERCGEKYQNWNGMSKYCEECREIKYKGEWWKDNYKNNPEFRRKRLNNSKQWRRRTLDA